MNAHRPFCPRCVGRFSVVHNSRTPKLFVRRLSPINGLPKTLLDGPRVPSV